jgi:hypothetical protein
MGMSRERLQPQVLNLNEVVTTVLKLLQPGINLGEKPFTEASLLTRLRAIIRAHEAI